MQEYFDPQAIREALEDSLHKNNGISSINDEVLEQAVFAEICTPVEQLSMLDKVLLASSEQEEDDLDCIYPCKRRG